MSGLPVRTRGLVHIYRAEGHDVAALSGVDLTVAAGERIALLGPSGAGKSTLLALFGGLLRPSAGRIHVGDHELSVMSEAQIDAFRSGEVGIVLQGAARNHLPWLTARGNVEFAQGAARRTGRTVPAVDELLGLLRLDEVADQPLESLTPGQLQLAALAVALAGAAMSPAFAQSSSAESAMSASAEALKGNPFAAESTLPLQYPHFDRIRDEHFAPAFDAGMAENLREIEAIAGNPEAPTFENTIEAMERSGELLTRSANVFFMLTGANTNATLQAAEEALAPKLAEHSDAIYLDPALFARVKTLFDQRDTLGLDAEQRTVLTRDVRDALRERGRDATLPETRRTRLLEMADAMDMFCQGADGEMFDRPGTPWPEADITIVDLATYAREGYNAQLSIAYISLISTVNNIAERD